MNEEVRKLQIRINQYENGLLEIRKIIENCHVNSANRGIKLLDIIYDKTYKLSYPEQKRDKELKDE